MAAPFGQTHNIRVYRNVLNIKHDLHGVLSQLDIYDEDKAAIFTESDSEYIAPVAGTGLTQRLAQLIVDASVVDLDEGYYVEVKKPMKLDGAWVNVETTTSDSLSAAATTIPVVRDTGFTPGDQVLIKDANGSELVKLQTVSTLSLAVYSDLALANSYLTAATVRATRFFQVVSVRWPHQLAPHRVADIMECLRSASS